MAEMKLVLARYDFSRVVDGAFSAPIPLLVGRKIVKVTYYHVGMGSPYSSLKIMRVKAGETPEKLGNKSTTDSTGKRPSRWMFQSRVIRSFGKHTDTIS